MIKRLVLLFVGLLLFSGCEKQNIDDLNTTPTGQLALLILSPGSPELSLYFSGQKAANKPLTFGTIIPYNAVVANKYELSFSKKDSSSVFAKINGEIKAGKYYTLIVGDKSPRASLALIEDDLSAPAPEKARIRFANLSPDSIALDLYIAGKIQTPISKQSFRSVSTFVNVEPGSALKIEIKAHGKTETLAVLDNAVIEKGKIYTIWSKGVRGVADFTRFGIDMMLNK